MFQLGLTKVPTEDLKRLLRAVHRETIDCPLAPDQLACVGLQHRSEDIMGTLRGMNERAIRAVLVCVLAERMPR